MPRISPLARTAAAISLVIGWLRGVESASDMIAEELEENGIGPNEAEAVALLTRKLENSAIFVGALGAAALNIAHEATPRASVVGGPVTHWVMTRAHYEALVAALKGNAVTPLALGPNMVDVSPDKPITFNPRS